MTVLSLQEAVERTGTSKVDIWRAIQAGALSAKKTDDGDFEIDLAVFSESFVDREPLAQLSAGNIDVDHCRPALADDGGAVEYALRDPLRDAPLRHVAQLGKF